MCEGGGEPSAISFQRSAREVNQRGGSGRTPTPVGHAVKDRSRITSTRLATRFPAPSPPRATWPSPCARCGGEGWGEGAISLVQAPSPRPSPPQWSLLRRQCRLWGRGGRQDRLPPIGECTLASLRDAVHSTKTQTGGVAGAQPPANFCHPSGMEWPPIGRSPSVEVIIMRTDPESLWTARFLGRHTLAGWGLLVCGLGLAAWFASPVAGQYEALPLPGFSNQLIQVPVPPGSGGGPHGGPPEREPG